MSLILTSISCLGIVHAADSNLTDELGHPAGAGQKVFELRYLRGGLSVAGCYSVGGVAMCAWMAEAVRDYEHQANHPTLRGFSDSLRVKLENEMTPGEKSSGSIVHVAGLVVDADGEHPEFYLVSNVTGIDSTTGAYLRMGESFGMSEDFWSRDFCTASARSEFASGKKGQIYINGYPAGRIVYLGLMQHLRTFLEAVWATPDWKFRPPKTLQELAVLVELQLSAIGVMFQISDYPARYIGGPVQTLLIS